MSSLSATADTAVGTAPMEVLLAHDFSGSTRNSGDYHAIAAKIAAAYPTATIILWDNTAREVTRKQLEDIHAAKEGKGGTEPECVAKYCVREKFHGHLVLITDGEVSNVENVDKHLSGWKFALVSCHIINHSPNLSVSCAFTRCSPSEVHVHQLGRSLEEVKYSVNRMTLEDLDVQAKLETVKSLEDWDATFAVLERAVIARTMGVSSDLPLRDSLISFKKQLATWQSRVAGESEAPKLLVEALEAFDWDAAVSAARSLTESYYFGSCGGPAWSRQMDRLIAMCTGALKNAFSSAAISTALVREAAAAPVSAADVALTEVGVGDNAGFVCPITLDVEADVVLLVKEGPPILPQFPKHVVDDLLVCPLNVFHHPEVLDMLKARLDHPVSLCALKEHTFTTSPITRAPLCPGGLAFGAHEEHVAASNWTLATVLNGGKNAGNMNLWFAVLWLIVRDDTHSLPYLSPLAEHFAHHMRYRLKHCVSYASLMGSPEYVTTRVPLGVAVWYVLAFPAITAAQRNDNNADVGAVADVSAAAVDADVSVVAAGSSSSVTAASAIVAGSSSSSMHALPDVLRAHVPHLSQLMDLFALLDFPLSLECEMHANRTRAMLALLAWVKRDETTLRAAVKALYQRVVVVDATQLGEGVATAKEFVPLIPVDGVAPEDQVIRIRAQYFSDACYEKLSVAEIVALAGMVSPLLSAKNIHFDVSWSAPPLPDAVVSAWSDYPEDYDEKPVPMCIATCRPFTYVVGQLWTEEYVKVHPKTPAASLPSAARFAELVARLERYPNPEELLFFMYKRAVLYGQHATLPVCVRKVVDLCFVEFAEIMAAVTPKEFHARFAASVKRDDRAVIDGTAAGLVR